MRAKWPGFRHVLEASELWPVVSAAGRQWPWSQGRVVPPFVFTPQGFMFYDEDEDLAHEFYEEMNVTNNRQKGTKLRRVHKNLIPQGTVKLDTPHIHVDFPVILYEV